jgi:hypothetical protein
MVLIIIERQSGFHLTFFLSSHQNRYRSAQHDERIAEFEKHLAEQTPEHRIASSQNKILYGVLGTATVVAFAVTVLGF